MSDLQQIALALTLATRRSLIVIDEFGKGTDSCGKDYPITLLWSNTESMQMALDLPVPSSNI